MKKNYDFSEKEIGVKIQAMMISIGIKIKKERLTSKMGRAELAYLAGTTENMICNIENGKKAGISVYTLVKISEALDIKLCILFEMK